MERKQTRNSRKQSLVAVSSLDYEIPSLPSIGPEQIETALHSPRGNGVQSSIASSVKLEECLRTSRTYRKRRNRRAKQLAAANDDTATAANDDTAAAADNDAAAAADDDAAATTISDEGKHIPEDSPATTTTEKDDDDTFKAQQHGESIESLLLKKLTELQTEECSSLSGAQITKNKQDQSDEILVLESIYESHFKLLKSQNDNDVSKFMISVSVEVAEALEVSLEFPSSTRAVDEASSSSKSTSSSSSYKFTVEHLPHIHLACVVNNSYPSHSPPNFILYARWLTTEKLLRLTQQMDQIWNLQKGEVVVYAWTEFLHTQALAHIGADAQSLTLTFSQPQSQSQREISGCTASPDADALFMLRYNEETKRGIFQDSLHLCNVCLNEFPGTSFVLLPCQHYYCTTCMHQYACMHVHEGSISKLVCPDTSCSKVIPHFVLRELLEDDLFERWENICLQKTLDRMSDVVYCPRCEMVCVEDDKVHHAQCAACFFNFCTLCRCAWHVVGECMSAEARLRILQERQKGRVSGEKQIRMEQNMINELLDMKIVDSETKRCPTCRIAIEKIEGCNKMTCTNCGNYFCFRCNKSIEDYAHFGDGSCELFETEEIERWEDRIMQQRNQAELFPERVVVCPTCRQRNVKQGNNNHMFCWACQNHYCALCSKIVRRASEHYGGNKCKQHTQ